MLLMHNGNKHCHAVLFLFYPKGLFFYVVGAVEFGSIDCCGALELCDILVQFDKVYLDVGPCFVACGLLFLLEQTILCEAIGPPHLGNRKADLFIAAGCNVPGFDLLGEVV